VAYTCDVFVSVAHTSDREIPIGKSRSGTADREIPIGNPDRKSRSEIPIGRKKKAVPDPELSARTGFDLN